MDIFTLQTSFINAFGDDLTDKVFACSSPPVQGKRQRLFGVGIVQETPHGFYNHLAHQVLSEQLLVQILLQSCMERPHCQRRGAGRARAHPARGGGRQPRAGAKGPGRSGGPREGPAGSARLPAPPPPSRHLPSAHPGPAPAAARGSCRCRQHSLK